jgi:hypothetical protein
LLSTRRGIFVKRLTTILNPMRGHAFISHSEKDKTFAQMLLAALEERGARCWIAPRDIPPGGSYADAIMRAIEECSCFVLVYTANANTSPHVLREVERALKFERNIIPVRFDESQPSRSLDYLLATLQWLSVDTPATKAGVVQAATQIAACILPEATPEVAAPPQVPTAERPTPERPESKGSGALKFVLLGIMVVLLLATAFLLTQLVARKSPLKTVAESTVPSSAATQTIPSPTAPPASTSPAVGEQIARALPTQAVAPTVETPPPSATEPNPRATLQRYFDSFAERDAAGAYNLLSERFRSALSFRKFSEMFSSTREMAVLEASVLEQTNQSAAISVKLDETEADYHHLYWQGQIPLELENGQWRIETLRYLKKIPAPGESPALPKLSPATSAPARTPEKRWDRPHIYLELANPSQMNAGRGLERQLIRLGYVVVEVRSVAGNVDIPSQASEIRYFTPGDAAEAQRMANEMRSFFRSTGVIAYLPEGMPYVSHARQYEVWFSSAFH